MASTQAPTDQTTPQGELVDVQDILTNAKLGLVNITELTEAAKASIEDSRKLSAEALAALQAKIAECSTTLTHVAAVKSQATDVQAVIATKSDHIQQAQEHADKVRAELDRTLTSATQQATAAEGQKTKAQSEADAASQLTTDIRTRKGAVETDAAAITVARKTAEDSAAVAKGLADKAALVEKKVADYEARLATLETQCAEQLETIKKLLPGATSAGLANAFDERRQTFLKPHNQWQLLFVVSVLAIVGLTYTGLAHVMNAQTPLTLQEVGLLWLARLPVAGALIWLAMHASREAALAKRLEEDYGYKAAIASCFEGFKNQVSEVGVGIAPDSALASLLKNTLATIATPPGRIYDKHKLAVSPTDEFTHAAQAFADAIKAWKPELFK